MEGIYLTDEHGSQYAGFILYIATEDLHTDLLCIPFASSTKEQIARYVDEVTHHALKTYRVTKGDW